ncbi:hypothetical protein HAX54_047208 [Datura stramonium]|uniref:Uncharacterized protein n=1 Tax=Datura stramonium TaxID=4076 RepID=A0ABS8SSP4_DATST|nr:hypothetical protein [Datura stramonium]
MGLAQTSRDFVATPVLSVKGLITPILLATAQLVSSGAFFQQVIDHVKDIETNCRRAYGGNNKNVRRSSSFNGTLSKGRGFSVSVILLGTIDQFRQRFRRQSGVTWDKSLETLVLDLLAVLGI